ncbi:MAG: hypothetical protein Q7J07_02190 [Pelolinea sp.]|nr:hypothetical protein [Pelolinea sp.]
MAINIGNVTIGNLWKSHTEVFNLLISHLNRYPDMDVQDAYVLIYQGAMGAYYYSADPKEFEERLFREFEETEADENQALWEMIRPDGELVRVHFAPLKARSGKPQALSTLCLWTASIFKTDKKDLTDGWDTFSRLCADNRCRKFSIEEVTEFTDWLVENNFPILRHSPAYRAAYHPHYRLVKREFLNILMEGGRD